MNKRRIRAETKLVIREFPVDMKDMLQYMSWQIVAYADDLNITTQFFTSEKEIFINFDKQQTKLFCELTRTKREKQYITIDEYNFQNVDNFIYLYTDENQNFISCTVMTPFNKYLKWYPKREQKDEDRNPINAGQTLLAKIAQHCADFKIGGLG